MNPHASFGDIILVFLLAAIATIAALILISWFVWVRTRVYRYPRTVTMHRLADRATLEQGRDRVLAQLASSESGTEKEFRLSMQRAEYDIALAEDPTIVREHVSVAVRLGLARLGSVDLDRFLEILFLVVAFGTHEERQEAARHWYSRRVGAGEPDARVALGEGIVELVDGNQEAGVQLAYAAKAETRQTLAWIAAAGVSFNRKWPLFERQIIASLAEYRNDYKNSPADPAGTMNVFALALCRLARDAGVPTVERSYLPLSLLPDDSA